MAEDGCSDCARAPAGLGRGIERAGSVTEAVRRLGTGPGTNGLDDEAGREAGVVAKGADVVPATGHTTEGAAAGNDAMGATVGGWAISVGQ